MPADRSIQPEKGATTLVPSSGYVRHPSQAPAERNAVEDDDLDRQLKAHHPVVKAAKVGHPTPNRGALEA